MNAIEAAEASIRLAVHQLDTRWPVQTALVPKMSEEPPFHEPGGYFETTVNQNQAAICSEDYGTGVLCILTVWVPYEQIFGGHKGIIIIARAVVRLEDIMHDASEEVGQCFEAIAAQVEARHEVLAQAAQAEADRA